MDKGTRGQGDKGARGQGTGGREGECPDGAEEVCAAVRSWKSESGVLNALIFAFWVEGATSKGDV